MVIQCPNCPTYLSIDYRWCPNCRTELNTPDLNRMRRTEEFEERWRVPIIVVCGSGLLLFAAFGIYKFVQLCQTYGLALALGIIGFFAVGTYWECTRQKTFTEQLSDSLPCGLEERRPRKSGR